MPIHFRALVDLCEDLEATSKRILKISLVVNFLKILDAEEIEPAISMMLGRPFPKWNQQTLGINWAILIETVRRVTGVEWSVFHQFSSQTGDFGSAIKSIFEKSKVNRQTTLAKKSLTILEMRRHFESIARTTGQGSRVKKERLIEAMLSQLSPVEAKYLIKIFINDMRTGFNEGLMEQAVSAAFQIPLETIQKATMTLGDIGEVAARVKMNGSEALQQIRFKVFRPVSLMLAQMSNDVSEALNEHGGRTAFEYKYDGARVQVHKLGDEVRIFSRRLMEITNSFPEILALIRANIESKDAILEGEVVAVDKSGYPIPFQHLMRRLRRVHGIAESAEKIPIKLYLFDVIYLNGRDLVSMPYSQRRQRLSEIAGNIELAKQGVMTSIEEASKFFNDALGAGHEGLMAKRLDGEYTPGLRGKRWLKIKPLLEPLDLVIIAAEWGYGRRHGWLSDYHLASRDMETGEFFEVGKTFKGLNDDEMIEMTERLKEIAISETPRGVSVMPKIVVEVMYNEIQESPKYGCGMTLRFARIRRIRVDKSAEEADTIQRIEEIYEKQFLKKGRYDENQ